MKGYDSREAQEVTFTKEIWEGCMDEGVSTRLSREGAHGQSVLLLQPDITSLLEGHRAT